MLNIQSSNIPLQLQEHNSKIITVNNIQFGFFSSKAISDKLKIEHSKVKRTIEKLIKKEVFYPFSHATVGTPNNAIYKISDYVSRGKTYEEYLLNHRALDLFIQSMSGTKGLQVRDGFIDFTNHALSVENQLKYETTQPFIKIRSVTKELAKEFNESISQVHKLAELQGSNTSLSKFEMSYNRLIKVLIVGSNVKGSWREHTDKIELSLLHLLLRTAITTLNHHIGFKDHYKEIYKSLKASLSEIMENKQEYISGGENE